ncbi:Haloacid Dehalogenase Superfamily Class (subfamily) IIA [Gracilibacillus ureilyticus]|uniref:Acid sugar phosphatase n=1 Tax=Gracilibacillus ureilyticus TaxID=531814 RepID=A0A1H9MLK7_9BACI|nr:HAD-IIA family hydrolase [Gracilibacillus ureilyticus]SER24431.1 Haloacid Dehalogenase Superfamily Class (subfamily) IIA [Gracilibacillus ureilyticus]
MISPNDYEAYCFDLDGTIYIGDQLLPGVKETLSAIRSSGKKVLFITNSPTMTRKDGKERLEQFGIEVSMEEVITTPYLAAIYFAEIARDATVFIIGEQAIREELDNLSIRRTDNPAKATHVLAGLDRSFTYKDLQQAVDAVRHCGKLIVTNPDPNCPVPGGVIPDTMSLAKAIEVASERKIDKVLGKPFDTYGDIMIELLGVMPEKILVIGDRLETDIQLGITKQFTTCLVLTGGADESDLISSSIKPDYVVKNLEGLFESKSKKISV